MSLILANLAPRVKQFIRAISARPLDQREVDFVSTTLNGKATDLFFAQPDRVQRHGIEIATVVSSTSSDRDVLAAALLHDVGKTRYTLRVWHQVAAILAGWINSDLPAKWGKMEARWWNTPFAIAERHTEWGAMMLEEAGCSSLCVSLVLHHHDSEDELVRLPEQTRVLVELLQKADSKI